MHKFYFDKPIFTRTGPMRKHSYLIRPWNLVGPDVD
jgi:hypothetical protein